MSLYVLSLCQPLLGLQSPNPGILSNLCKSASQKIALLDFIYGCLIFNWVAVTWLRDGAPGY